LSLLAGYSTVNAQGSSILNALSSLGNSISGAFTSASSWLVNGADKVYNSVTTYFSSNVNTAVTYGAVTNTSDVTLQLSATETFLQGIQSNQAALMAKANAQQQVSLNKTAAKYAVFESFKTNITAQTNFTLQQQEMLQLGHYLYDDGFMVDLSVVANFGVAVKACVLPVTFALFTAVMFH